MKRIHEQLQLGLILLNNLRKDKSINKFVKNSRWSDYSINIYNSIIKNINLEDFRSDYDICRGYGDAIKPHLPSFINSKFLNKIFNFPLLRNLRNKYSRFKYFQRKNIFLDNLEINREDYFKNDYFKPERVFKINGLKFSEKYIRSILFNKKFISIEDKNIFCEIGGGFGANIHTTLQRNKNIRKVIAIDIPPVLYVQTTYLKKIYPDSVVDYSDIKHINKFSFKNDYSLEILCIPPWFISKIQDNVIDVIVNHNSFQEIDIEIVDLMLSNIFPKLKENFNFFFSFYEENRLDDISKLFENLLLKKQLNFLVKKDFLFDQKIKLYTNK